MVVGTRARPLLGLHSVQEKVELARGNSLWLWMLISLQKHLTQIRPNPQGPPGATQHHLGALLYVRASGLDTDNSQGGPFWFPSVPSASLSHPLPGRPSYARTEGSHSIDPPLSPELSSEKTIEH